MDEPLKVDRITEKIIGCVYKVSNTLGGGFLEKVYENAVALEISKTGLMAKPQYAFGVLYDGASVGSYVADMVVADQVLVEFKAVKALDDVHTAQCQNYLRATGLPVCLLINFYRPKVEIKRLVANAAWVRR